MSEKAKKFLDKLTDESNTWKVVKIYNYVDLRTPNLLKLQFSSKILRSHKAQGYLRLFPVAIKHVRVCMFLNLQT